MAQRIIYTALLLSGLTVPRLILHNAQPVAILTYSGPVSGTNSFLTNNTLNLTTSGVYTFTVSTTMTLKVKAAAPGCNGLTGGINANGGSGNISGATNVAGQNQSFASGTTYEAQIGAAGTSTETHVKVQGGAQINQLQAGCAGGAVTVGSGVAGSAGGSGGSYNSVSPGGSAGSQLAGGAGGGGGGGTVGSIECGLGFPPGGSSGGSPPCDGSSGGIGAFVVVAGISTAWGGGGGGSGSFNFGAGSAGGPGGVSLTFVSIP